MENILRTPMEGLKASKKMTMTNIIDKMSVNTINQYRGSWIVKTEKETFILVKKPAGLVKVTIPELMAMDAKEYYNIIVMFCKGASCTVTIDEDMQSKLNSSDGMHTVPMYVHLQIRDGKAEVISDTKPLHFVIDFTDSDLYTENAVSVYGPFTYFKEAKKYMASISKVLDCEKDEIYDYTTTSHLYRMDNYNCRSLRVVTLNLPLKLEPEFVLARYSCGVTSSAQHVGIVGVYETKEAAERFKKKYALNNDFGYEDSKEFIDNGATAYDMLTIDRIYGAQEI